MADQSFRKALTLWDDYHGMMADGVRLDAYRRAIEATVREGDVVIDLGAGLGLLGFLALRAGAARVYAIEKGDALELARRVAADNGLADRVVFVDEHSLDAELPEPADVLLSETLGSFAFEENTLAFTIDARDRLLREGGRMIPRRLTSFLAPVEARAEHARRLFWREVAGLDFSAALDESLSRMGLMDLRPNQLLAAPQVFADVDLRRVTSPSLAQKLIYPIRRAGTCHGLAGWFRAELVPGPKSGPRMAQRRGCRPQGDETRASPRRTSRCDAALFPGLGNAADGPTPQASRREPFRTGNDPCEGVQIETGPDRPATHWRQAFFPYREQVTVGPSDFMEVRFALTPKDARSDDTDVHYEYRATQRASQVSPGRNDPCPCGSGKKYKRCCAR